MLVLLVLILATGAAVYYATLQMGRHIDPPSLSTLPVNPEVAENHYIRVGWKIDASEQLAGFLAASTIDEKLAFVLEPERIRPLMERLYGPLPHRESDTPIEAYSLHELSEQDRRRGIFMMIFDRPPQVDMREFFRPLASLEVQHSLTEADMLLSAVARLDNFELEPIRAHAFFKRTSAGLKLDWEVFVQTKYRTLRDFIELPEAGASAVFRVIIMEDVPPKGMAVAGTRTYRFTCPANHGDSARVNVPVDSDFGRELAVLNWRGTEGATPIARTATIEVTWSEDPDTPELTLSRFLCWEFLGLGGSAP